MSATMTLSNHGNEIVLFPDHVRDQAVQHHVDWLLANGEMFLMDSRYALEWRTVDPSTGKVYRTEIGYSRFYGTMQQERALLQKVRDELVPYIRADAEALFR